MKTKLIVVGLISFSTIAWADEIPSSPGRFSIYGGLTLGPSTNHDIRAGGTVIGTASSDDKASILVGAEYRYHFPTPPFGIAGIVDWSKYQYKSGGKGDSHLSIMPMPFVSFQNGSWSYWGGFGLGLVFTSLGESTGTSNGMTLTLESSATSLALSPRVGLDFHLPGGQTLGLQVSYFMTTVGLNGSVTSGGTTARFTDDASRKWFAVNLKVGF